MILVFGTICLDRVRRVPKMPESGGYVEIASELLLLGGEAANTACALAAWGADVVLAGNDLGRGAVGEMLRADLFARGILPIGNPASREFETPICDVYVTDTGERTMIGQGFSTMEGSFDPGLLPLRAGEWFTAEPNMPATARRAARLAKEAGMKLYVMDMSEEDDAIGPGDVWQSSTDWVGVRGDSAANLSWVQRWADLKGCLGILTDGGHGFVAASPTMKARQFDPVPIGQVVDATGAGDFFRAGMLFGLSQDWEVERCLAFAAAAGALACRSLGATVDIPWLDEVLDLVG